MKKILFATTALVAFAGAAAAEVSISGEAEMGIVGGNGIETQYWQEIEVEFSMTGESDSGISFGAVIQLDEADGPESDDNGARVFISGAFGTLTMGDTDGALDWALTEAGNVGNPGSIADNETEHAGYNGSYADGTFDNQVLRYDYAFDSFSFAVSLEQGATGAGGILLAGDPDGSIAVGVRYALDFGGTTIDLGLGYQDTDFNTADNETIIGISATAEFAGGFSAGINFSDWSDFGGATGLDATHTGLGLGYENGPIALHANYGVYDVDGVGEAEGFGVSAAYDLGGGLSANFGYGDSSVDAPLVGIFGPDRDDWSFGMVMEF